MQIAKLNKAVNNLDLQQKDDDRCLKTKPSFLETDPDSELNF